MAAQSRDEVQNVAQNVDPDVVVVMLAGGRGSRLHELTDTTCKPAVPFAGGRRIVDWTMDNLLRCTPARLLVATQYRPDPLIAHLNARWRAGFAPGTLSIRDGATVTGRSAGYVGTADAVTQNLAEISSLNPDLVLVVAADHVYHMDYAAMIAAHRAGGCPATVAVDRMPLDQARAFGVMAADSKGRIIAWQEKPRKPAAMRGDPGRALVSMGIYVFDWAWLRAVLRADERDPSSSHDFGHDILPAAVDRGEAQIFDAAAATGGAFFWRDVGTLDALRETCIEIATGQAACPCPPYPGNATIPTATQVLDGGTVVLPGGHVSPGARLKNAIVAPGAIVPRDLVAGFDPERDARYFRSTPGGTVLITGRMLAHRSAEGMRQALRPPRRAGGAGVSIHGMADRVS